MQADEIPCNRIKYINTRVKSAAVAALLLSLHLLLQPQLTCYCHSPTHVVELAWAQVGSNLLCNSAGHSAQAAYARVHLQYAWQGESQL